MSSALGDELIVDDGPVAPQARFYGWLLDHLAKFPGRVTAVTFAAGVVVTVVVVMIDGDETVTTVVSLVATLWALFFALMIYLLTARDNDKVLDQIADLHEQLATALAAPDDAVENVSESAGAEQALPAPTVDSSADRHPDLSGSEVDRSVPTSRGDRYGRSDAVGGRQPLMLSGVAAIADGVPRELLDAWSSATGESREKLSRAWSRDPSTDQQWVLESIDDHRWVVFSRGARGTGVIPLDGPGRGRAPRPSRIRREPK